MPEELQQWHHPSLWAGPQGAALGLSCILLPLSAPECPGGCGALPQVFVTSDPGSILMFGFRFLCWGCKARSRAGQQQQREVNKLSTDPQTELDPAFQVSFLLPLSLLSPSFLSSSSFYSCNDRKLKGNVERISKLDGTKEIIKDRQSLPGPSTSQCHRSITSLHLSQC